MTDRPSLLIVDDESAILDSLRILFKNEGFEVSVARGGPAAQRLEGLAAARERDPDLPVILMTAQAELKTAIEAVNRGAFHYIQKPFDNDELIAICRRALEHRQLKAENRVLKQEIQRRERSQAVKPIGASKVFRDVLRMAETVAPTDSIVLIQGESGTGKEVIARYIHGLSERQAGPFLSINCGALPEGLLESELFGHVKGSFTGAVRDHGGLFAAAGGGSFFLDEIGEMTPATQIKLLRVLQEREATPVGGTQPVPVDVRLIAATNRDLEDDMKAGRFRSDLYYRLNVIAIHLPPLRARKDDIPLLADAFLRRMASERGQTPKTIGTDAMAAIMACDWPGNVRELENAVERAVVLASQPVVTVDVLPDHLLQAGGLRIRRDESGKLAPDASLFEIVADFERRVIIERLEQCSWSQTEAAADLNVPLSTLNQKIKRLNIEVKRRRAGEGAEQG